MGPIIIGLGEDPHPAAYGQVGTAIDYRIRYHFAHTLGSELVAWNGAVFLADWRDQRAIALERVRGLALRAPLSQACLDSFFRNLDRSVGEIGPCRRPPSDAEERTLARFCLVLAALEAVRRWPLAWPPPWLSGHAPRDTADLLSLVPDEWVDDAATLGAAFSKRHAAWRGSDAVLNPTFDGSADIGGADGDFIIDGCLWDIKTITGQGARSIDLYQILGYALLDYGDAYSIERVGLFFPRHGTHLSWPISELIARASGRSNLELPDLRQQFRTICEGIREEPAARRA